MGLPPPAPDAAVVDGPEGAFYDEVTAAAERGDLAAAVWLARVVTVVSHSRTGAWGSSPSKPTLPSGHFHSHLQSNYQSPLLSHSKAKWLPDAH